MIGPTLALGMSFLVPQQPDPALALRQALAHLPQTAKDPINRFGLDALAKLNGKSQGKNLMISPWSLQECFGMLRLGARGATDQELSRFLFQTQSARDAAVGLKQVSDALAPLVKTNQLQQANGIWLAKGSSLKPNFVKDVKTYFGAPVKETTFPDPALSDVNGFVSKTTRGKIPKLFDRFERDTELVLVNAISFLDKWSIPFDKKNTKSLPFHLAGGKTKDVPTMAGTGHFSYGKTDSFQLLNMPYQSGLSMTILLPNSGVSLSRILAKPDLLSFLGQTHDAPGQVWIPRWKSEFNWDIAKWMKGQGYKICFEAEKADFSGMSRRKLIIDQALQKTYIKVDEEGTEAAAATGISMRPTAARPDQPFVFRADRPFAYFIGSPGGVVYFAGVVNDPAA